MAKPDKPGKPHDPEARLSALEDAMDKVVADRLGNDAGGDR